MDWGKPSAKLFEAYDFLDSGFLRSLFYLQHKKNRNSTKRILYHIPLILQIHKTINCFSEEKGLILQQKSKKRDTLD